MNRGYIMQISSNSIVIRELLFEDRPKLLSILSKTKFFSDDEIKVATELIDQALNNPNQRDYLFGVGEIENQVVGYVCYGHRACTISTWDLYWICVDPLFQNKGIGKALLNWVESQVISHGCSMLVVETSGNKLYEPTRRFYEKQGYTAEAVIKDFYSKGDDLVIYIKRFTSNDKNINNKQQIYQINNS